MTARSARQYLEGIRDNREIWLGNEKVDIFQHPALAGSLQGMAGYYDWQHRFADDCLVPDPVTGQLMSASLIVPTCREDLDKRGRCFEQLAKYSQGMLGRTPDYVNVALSGYVARYDFFRDHGHRQWGDNLKNFHREVIEKDLSMTHTIIQPAIDKNNFDLSGLNGDIALRVIKRNRDSIVVRGAKILATLGPFADELYVYPAAPILGNPSPDHAVSFSIPVNTPGVITICRDHYSVDADIKDKPFSSRFDEQDGYVIFDDVEIPMERVFMDGDIEFYNQSLGIGWYANVTQQTATRAAVKLEFAYDLCTRMAQITNADKRPEVAMMLGEIWSYSCMARSALSAGLNGAKKWGDSAFFLDDNPMRALIAMMPQWMVRVNDIIKTLGSHNLLATPSLDAFENPEMATLLKQFIPGAAGHSAEERAQIFRIAWDFAGSALGSRVELYERFYLASQPRNLMLCHMNAQNTRQWHQVDDFMKNCGIK